MMETENIVAPADIVKRQPKSRLVSIVSILRFVAHVSEGELTVAEVTDALASGDAKAYDGDTMMLYWGGCYGLAEPINDDSETYSGYNQRAELICDLCNGSSYWDDPGGATMLVRPFGRIDVKDLLVLIDDGVEMAGRLWRFFYPNQGKAIDISRIAEGAGTKRSEEKPGYSTPLLAILNAAIAEFFDPRRNADAKKDEVVEWIKSKMIATGKADSDNIAAAIFTIIKPENHDPRKRRG